VKDEVIGPFPELVRFEFTVERKARVLFCGLRMGYKLSEPGAIIAGGSKRCRRYYKEIIGFNKIRSRDRF